LNYKMMGRFLGWIFAALTVFMIPPAILCLADGDYADALAFLYRFLLRVYTDFPI